MRGNIGMALPHELLTPLNGILGFASLMMDERVVLDPLEVRDFARNIHLSAVRLHRLIENFLLYSQTELARTDPATIAEWRQTRRTLTQEILAGVAGEKAAAAGRQNDLSLETEEAYVSMGPDFFRKIIDELVDNAFKFSTRDTPVCIVARLTRNLFTLSITDRGRGMAAQQIADIGAHMQFERRFYEQQGVGLGLIIARRLAELHGGDFAIESTPGEGTAVRLTLPQADQAT